MTNLIPLTDEERATRRQVLSILEILSTHLGAEIEKERRGPAVNYTTINALQSVRIAVLDTIVSTSILNFSSTTEANVPTTH